MLTDMDSVSLVHDIHVATLRSNRNDLQSGA